MLSIVCLKSCMKPPILFFNFLCENYRFVVTAGGGGQPVPGRVYREYKLGVYSSWLKKHITDDKNWHTALVCVVGSKACNKIATYTPLDYLQRDLSPIQVCFADCHISQNKLIWF